MASPLNHKPGSYRACFGDEDCIGTKRRDTGVRAGDASKCMHGIVRTHTRMTICFAGEGTVHLIKKELEWATVLADTTKSEDGNVSPLRARAWIVDATVRKRERRWQRFRIDFIILTSNLFAYGSLH